MNNNSNKKEDDDERKVTKEKRKKERGRWDGVSTNMKTTRTVICMALGHHFPSAVVIGINQGLECPAIGVSLPTKHLRWDGI